MKRCLKCQTKFNSNSWSCPTCDWCPEYKQKTIKFADHIQAQNESFNPDWFLSLTKLEEGNLWFQSRNKLLQYLFHKLFQFKANYLEIGCGTGFVLKMVEENFPNWTINASEAHSEGLDFTQKRLRNLSNLFQIDALDIPFSEEFDVIGAFDVAEHIEDDLAAIQQINSAFKIRGYLILSVP